MRALKNDPGKKLPGRTSTFLAILVCSLMAVFMLVPKAHAQYRASLRGVVSDPTTAVIPGATVTLTNTETGEKQVHTTDENGIYNFNALPPGHFSITVVRDGFQQHVVNDVQIIPEQPNALNIQLQLGQESQTVTVVGSDIPAIDTEIGRAHV